jgi:hypothetical protein
MSAPSSLLFKIYKHDVEGTSGIAIPINLNPFDFSPDPLLLLDMDLATEILKEHSKRQAARIASRIGSDKKRFRQLMALFLKGEYRITQRSAWIVNLCADKHPELIRPYLKQMIGRMQEPGVHDAVKRNVVRILQFIEIPEKLLGEVATVCFNYLSSPDEPIAVRVFSMTVLANIAQREPELKNELRLVIEQQLSGGSMGFCSRAGRVLKMIQDGSER